jgi:HSP20 family molecular chaperone IbpA
MTTTTSQSEPQSETRATADRETVTLAPPIDIYETETEFVLFADMPGVAPEGLEVVVERNTLRIRGRAGEMIGQPEYQEFELGDYRATFAITDDLDTDRIAAALRDGVLRIQIPKSERLRPKKIRVGSE